MKASLAFFLRELHTAILSRTIHLFAVLAVLVGLGPLLDEGGLGSSETIAWVVFQSTLYLVPLAALLIGVGSSQGEWEEWPLLMSQPVRKGARLAGKFFALWFVVGAAALLFVAPAILMRSGGEKLLFLWLHAAGAGGVFMAMGLAVGFSAADRVKAHMIALGVWLLFLAGGDLIALALARSGWAEESPRAWLALLMLNPLDALRISGLISLQKIPFDLASDLSFGRWWLAHPGRWFAMLSAGWIALGLAWSWWQMGRARL